MEGSARSLIEVLSQHLRGGTEKTTKYLIQHSRFCGLDSNRAPTECKSRPLQLPQPARYYIWYCNHTIYTSSLG
jgi:hypothetical protein